MKRILISAAMVLILLGLVAYFFRGPLFMAAAPRLIAANMNRNVMEDVPDGLHVVVCGAGSPLPDPQRSGPCLAVIAGDELYVVDSGAGSSRIMRRVGVPQGRVEGVFLTHFHSDHIDGLGELQLQRWASGRHEAPLPIYGPSGVEHVVDGINQAYGPSRVTRVAHHGEDILSPASAGGVARPFPQPEDGELVVLHEGDGLRISVFAVNHFPVEPAVGYRFDYKGRSIVVSGDTVKSANLQRQAEGVDLLIHEALDAKVIAAMAGAAEQSGLSQQAKMLHDILDYHATPVEAAEVARDAGVSHLLYYHIVPPLIFGPMETIFLEGVDEVYDGPVTLSRDGTMVMLPAGSDSVDVKELL